MRRLESIILDCLSLRHFIGGNRLKFLIFSYGFIFLYRGCSVAVAAISGDTVTF